MYMTLQLTIQMQLSFFDKPAKNISKSLLNQPGIKANKKKVSIIKWSDDEVPDYGSISDQMDKILAKLSK